MRIQGTSILPSRYISAFFSCLCAKEPATKTAHYVLINCYIHIFYVRRKESLTEDCYLVLKVCFCELFCSYFYVRLKEPLTRDCYSVLKVCFCKLFCLYFHVRLKELLTKDCFPVLKVCFCKILLFIFLCKFKRTPHQRLLSCFKSMFL